MAFLDKLNSLAAQAGEKANSALETGKLTLKIREEEKKINDYAERLGKIIIDRMDGGQEMDAELAEIYELVLASRNAISQAKAELDAEKTGGAPAAGGKFCPSCGAKLTEGVRFCNECGAKIE